MMTKTFICGPGKYHADFHEDTETEVAELVAKGNAAFYEQEKHATVHESVEEGRPCPRCGWLVRWLREEASVPPPHLDFQDIELEKFTNKQLVERIHAAYAAIDWADWRAAAELCHPKVGEWTFHQNMNDIHACCVTLKQRGWPTDNEGNLLPEWAEKGLKLA